MQQLAQRRVLDVLIGKQIDVELVDGAREFLGSVMQVLAAPIQ